MPKLFAINFPDDRTKLSWLRLFATADKASQQQMATDAAKRWPMPDGVVTGKETVQ